MSPSGDLAWFSNITYADGETPGVRLYTCTFDIPWTYAVFWLLMNVEGLLQGMLAWGVAAIVCDTRQAKRLFPLFAAGGIFGGVVGGFVTRPLAELLGTENLLAVWSGSLVLAFFVARTLLSRHVVAPTRVGTSLIQDMQAGYRYVRSSPLWRAVSAATVLFAVLYFSLTFPFAKAATLAYPSAEQLAGFFGVFEYMSVQGLAVYGVSQEQAATWAIGYHLFSFIPITLIGAYYFTRLGVRLRDLQPSTDAAA